MKKLLSGLLVLSFVLVGCGSNDKSDNKKLTVLTNSGYPPYEMVDTDGSLYGFDIEVMEMAAEIAGYEVEWQDVDFESIVDSIKLGKADVAIAGITPDAERAKKVDFSEAYYESGEMENVVLVKKDSGLKTTADLKGKKLGVQMGTIQDLMVESIIEEYELQEPEKLKNYADLVQELNNNVIDAMIVEKATALEFIEKHDNLECYVFEAGAELDGNAMIFKQGSELKADFDKAIQEMKANGELDKLIKKWFKE